MSIFWQLIREYWEKMFFFANVLVFLLAVWYAVDFLSTGEPRKPHLKRMRPEPRLFSWEEQEKNCFQPEILPELSPNPFQPDFSLKVIPKPVVVVPPSPPVAVSVPVEEVKEEPPPPPPVLALVYRGSYTSIKGEEFVLLQYFDSRIEKPETFVCRLNDSLPQGFRLTAQNRQEIVVTAEDGHSITVPWNARVELK